MPNPRYKNLLLAAFVVVLVFIALNFKAYDGYFQDDELDVISWAPSLGLADYAPAFAKPLFDTFNFRPSGHLYFTLLSKAFGLNFPPYITPVFAGHVINGILLFFILRRVGIEKWTAWGGATFFLLSGSAMDVYWKPMYVFDLYCTTFTLASILLWAHQRWMLSFVAYWLAYKAKELAVMLPFVLLAWEYWFGDKARGSRRYLQLAPFFAASLSFGIQGLLFNPNKDNDYTFRFTVEALKKTIPFYERRFLMFRGGSLLLVPLLFVKDRRVWFGLTGMAAFASLLLFLPGRLFEAYTYLPLACLSIALAAASTRVPRMWAARILLVWLSWNSLQLRKEQREVLRQGDVAFAFVDSLENWIRQHPSIRVLVYEGMPGEYHRWGVTGIWNILHNNANGMQALSLDTPEGKEALASQPVGYVQWDSVASKAAISIHSPLPLDPQVPTPK